MRFYSIDFCLSYFQGVISCINTSMMSLMGKTNSMCLLLKVENYYKGFGDLFRGGYESHLSVSKKYNLVF